MRKIRPILISFINLFATLGSRAQTIDPLLAASLQWQLDSLRAAHDIQGISAAVLLADGTRWSGVAGESHPGTPITTDMAFGIGSNTKTFTAALVLKAMSAGNLDLDDALGTWLPPYANIDPAITIRQALNHTSGVAEVTDVPGYIDSILIDPTRVYSADELMSWVGAPLFTPGTSWQYTNTNYLLAGLVAEQAMGPGYVQLLQDSLLTPLGLDSTYLTPTGLGPTAVAHPWQGGNDWSGIPRISLNTAAGAAGAMYSTANEMVHWYSALMSGEVLDSAAFTTMTTFVGSGEYGCGLARQQLAGRTAWGHGGDIIGYRSIMVYDTASQAAIAVLINQNPAPAALVAQQLLLALVDDLAMDVPPAMARTPELRCWPNPARDAIHIAWSDHALRSIELIDQTGGTVYRSEQNRIDVSGLPAGLYVIRASANDEPAGLTRFVKLP